MQEINGEIEEINGVDGDFSFVCLNPDGSPISAEDAFLNGQIRHEFPMFHHRILTGDQTTSSLPSQLDNLFISSADDAAAVPELGKRSYSTGFSKLWRFGEKIRRSRSEGKEAFVFLRSASSGSGKGGGEKKAEEKNGKKKKEAKVKKGKGKGEETASYYHERHYGRNRTENEMNKRKSYLPYRSNLMGFFTAPNGLNRNF